MEMPISCKAAAKASICSAWGSLPLSRRWRYSFAANPATRCACAQGGVRHAHVLDTKLVKRGAHDGQAARKYGRAVLAQAGQLKALDLARLEEGAPQLVQTGCRNPVLPPALRLQNPGNRARGA